ncbi:serine protease [Rhizobium ruizarguesonis]
MEEMIQTRDPAFQQFARATTFPITFGNSQGTGFFIGRTLAVTAAHVIDPGRKEPKPGTMLTVSKNGVEIEFVISALHLSELSNKHDLVLLEARNYSADSCAVLDAEARLEDTCWVCGYTSGRPEGDGVTVDIEHCETERLRVKAGQIDFGSSGAPLFNLRTSRVVGIALTSFDTNSDRGGGVVSSSVLLDLEEVRRQNASSPSRLRSYGEEKRLSGPRPRNYSVRTELIESVLPKICNRGSASKKTTLVILGPSGYGKTSFADDLFDLMEVKLGRSGTRFRCSMNAIADVPRGSLVLCDGLNEIAWQTPVLVNWIQRLGTPLVITMNDRDLIPVLRRACADSSDDDSFLVLEMPPLTAEQTKGIVASTDLPCVFEEGEIGSTIQDLSLGSPFLVQLALDLACSGMLNVLPEDLRQPDSLDVARRELFTAWRENWLQENKDCRTVANILCLVTLIGLSEEAFAFILGKEIDVGGALEQLKAKGLIFKADIFDRTFVPHRLLRKAYSDADLVMNDEFVSQVQSRLLTFVTNELFAKQGPIRDPLTIIEGWIQLLRKSFNHYETTLERNKQSPYVQFTNDLLGELSRRARGVSSTEWQNWLVQYFQATLSEWLCCDKIPMSQAILRVAPLPIFGEAFTYGWRVQHRTKEYKNSEPDHAGESYCLLASVRCWLTGDSSAVEQAFNEVKDEWMKRRLDPERYLSFALYIAFACAFLTLGKDAFTHSVLSVSAREEKPDIVASLALLCLANGNYDAAERISAQNVGSLDRTNDVVREFLFRAGLSVSRPQADTIRFNPNLLGYMAFASGNHQFMDIVHDIIGKAEKINGVEMRIGRQTLSSIVATLQ